MRTTKTKAHGLALRAPTTILVLALLAALLLAGTALAGGHEGIGKSARPGMPTAKAPKGTIVITMPTFTWSKVAGAAKYELRVYEGSTPLLKKTGITKLSWKSTEVLPLDVTLTWKVRAGNARGSGAWSKSLPFKIVPSLAIGAPAFGGVVAYILQSGDAGYDANEQHGLIAATADQGTFIRWAVPDYQSTSVPGGTGTAIGTGSANTDKIIAQNGAGSTYAAGLARAYTSGVYSDWYLPSKDELNKLCANRVAIGGFASTIAYASSSELNAKVVWIQSFDYGVQDGSYKYPTYRVRAVRTF